jgi:hypothetical protein
VLRDQDALLIQSEERKSLHEQGDGQYCEELTGVNHMTRE